MTRLTKTEVKGSHEMLNEAEALARLLRIATGQRLSLAVVPGLAVQQEDQGYSVSWQDAHELIDALARTEGEDGA